MEPTTLREKLANIGAKVMSHAKYIALQLDEVTVPRKLAPVSWTGSARCVWPLPRAKAPVGRKSGREVGRQRAACVSRQDCGAGRSRKAVRGPAGCPDRARCRGEKY